MPVSKFFDDYERPNNAHGRDVELVEGELVDEVTADVVTCGLETFDQYMRKVYRDWDAFLAYVEERTGEYSDTWWQSLGKEIQYAE